MAIKFINLTAHKIVLNDLVIPPSGTVALVETKQDQIAEFQGIAIDTRYLGKVKGLPPQRGVMMKPGFCESVWDHHGKTREPTIDRIIYLVSSFVLSAVPARSDVAAPDSGESAIRNEDGHVVSVSRLIMNLMRISKTMTVDSKNNKVELLR